MSGVAEARRWDTGKLASALVMGVWGALFWYLMISGRTTLYLSTRTDWVVPVGAVILTVATAGRLASARSPHPGTMSVRELAGHTAILLPAVVILALPSLSLGSYAAARRSSFSSVAIASSPEDLAEGELTLIDLGGAMRSREGLAALAARAGTEVSFDGFVVREKGMPADEFRLTRFIVACCVADALEVNVRVVGVTPGKFAEDEWVRVEGALYPLGTQMIVQATEVTKIEKPDEPYLTP